MRRLRRVALGGIAFALAMPVGALGGGSNVQVGPISAQPGVAFSGQVATFRHIGKEDSNKDETATINWGDGTPVTSGVVVPDPCEFCENTISRVNGSHTYAAPGSYTVTVTVDDAFSSPASGTGTATVSASATPTPSATGTATAAPTPTAPPVGQAPTALMTASAQATTTRTLVRYDARASADPEGGALRFEWDLNGDGTFELDTGPSPYAGASYGEPGRRDPKVRVTDPDGGSSIGSLGIKVKPGKLDDLEDEAREDGKLGKYVSPDVSYGSNVVATPADPPPPLKCPEALTFGVAEVRALIGCLQEQRIKGVLPNLNLSRYQSRAIMVNGIRFSAATGPVIDITPHLSRIATTTKAITSVDGSTVGLGSVRFRNAPIDLHLPKSAAADRVRIAEAQALAPGKHRLGPLPVINTGDAHVTALGRSEFDVTVAPPDPFGQIGTGEVTLRASSDKGLETDAFKLEINMAYLGLISVSDLALDFDLSTGAWGGGARMNLGYPLEIDAYPSAERPLNGFHYDGQGGFSAGAAANFDPGIPIDGAAIAKLRRIGFAFSSANPFLLSGDVRVTAGPDYFGVPLVDADACAILAVARSGDRVQACGLDLITDQNVTLFRVDADVAFLSFPMSSAYLDVRSPGSVRFGGSLIDVECCLDVGIASLKGGLNGGFAGAYWQVKGGIDACLDAIGACAGASAIVSDGGMGVCVPPGALSPLPIYGMLGWRYDSSPDIALYSCDLSPYQSKGAGYISRAGTRTFNVEPGVEALNFRLTGRDGPPQVVLRGPGGVELRTPADGEFAMGEGATAAYLVPESRRSYLAVRRPAAGRWTISELDGSTPITAVATARERPPVRIRAKVTGKGAARSLRYRVAGAKPKDVVFVEQAGAMSESLGRARSRRGALRFRPAAGPGGRRTITARVEGGFTPTEQRVTTYRARPMGKLAAPRGLRCRRANGGRAGACRWRRVAGASDYRVMIAAADGRSVARLTRAPRARLKGLRSGFSAKVTVTARIGPRDGRPARARLARVRR